MTRRDIEVSGIVKEGHHDLWPNRSGRGAVEAGLGALRVARNRRIGTVLTIENSFAIGSQSVHAEPRAPLLVTHISDAQLSAS